MHRHLRAAGLEPDRRARGELRGHLPLRRIPRGRAGAGGGAAAVSRAVGEGEGAEVDGKGKKRLAVKPPQQGFARRVSQRIPISVSLGQPAP